jgi:hypothetical protein
MTARERRQDKSANQRLEQALSNVRLSEMAVSRLYERMMKTCDTVGQVEWSNVQTVVTKVRQLDKNLAQIDLRLKRSIQTMRQRTDANLPGIVAFRTGIELQKFDNAYGDYSRLLLSVHEISEAVVWLSRDLPKAQQLCQPIAIPALTAEPPPLPVAKPRKVRNQAPLSVQVPLSIHPKFLKAIASSR